MLQITWTTDRPTSEPGQLLAVAVAEGGDLARLETSTLVGLKAALESARFRGKVGQKFHCTESLAGGLRHVLVVGMGKDPSRPEALRRLGSTVSEVAVELGATSAVLDLRQGPSTPPNPRDAARVASVLAQGLELGTYAYTEYLSESKRTPKSLVRATVVADGSSGAEGLAAGQVIAAAMGMARDMVNAPAAQATPAFLADRARAVAADGGPAVSLTVLEREDCEARKMGCYLAVAQGSDNPPKFIHLQYKPSKPSKGRACLIGKGVTFDSGGYSLKPMDGMLDMKMDMAGAASVIAAFDAIVKLGLPWEVHAIVPAAENMVSGHAYRLGDILRASNGKTVEVNNTDAEGRLCLADALVYAAKLEPDFMIDFATLTGACVIALGPGIAGVMTTDDALADAWLSAGKRTGEAMWRLPLPEELKDQLKSKIADMKNTGLRSGGALTAGLFLSEFAEGRRWMHVDIAGPGMGSKAWGSTEEGGTGFGVASIVELLSGDPP